MESLLDNDTRLALEKIARPLKVKIENVQIKLSNTLILLEDLTITLHIRHKVLPKYTGGRNENHNDHK